MSHLTPVIPEYITVHLGTPGSNAENVTVRFTEYIKNVASSELFPTWPVNALAANIYAQVSFALNRIFNEHYRSRGYDFDITNSTAFDQSFVNGREIYKNVGVLVDELFNDYVVKAGQIQPYFTQYCNGTDVTCEGLSQWGTVGLAGKGYTPYQILQYYYGNDVGIVRDAPIKANVETYPGIPLRLGSAFQDSLRIQKQLNRIAEVYPAIPKIPIGVGIFDEATRDAVKKFQEIFNLPVDGIVGKATWYKIKFVYNGVTGAERLDSGGITPEEAEEIFNRTYRIGDSDIFVGVVQYYLNFISQFNRSVPTVKVDSKYGPQTAGAVSAFQQAYGLPIDGIVGRNTWNKLQQVYLGIINMLPKGPEPSQVYPGYFITTGSPPETVKQLQTFLSVIAQHDKTVPPVDISGVYDAGTRAAVTALQKKFGILQSGYVGPVIWGEIVKLYNEYRKQNP